MIRPAATSEQRLPITATLRGSHDAHLSPDHLRWLLKFQQKIASLTISLTVVEIQSNDGNTSPDALRGCRTRCARNSVGDTHPINNKHRGCHLVG
jgi:hypothetical protein